MTLQYNKDGKFKIIQFTDTHIGNMPFHEDDHKTFHLVEQVLKNIDADLIVHTGDIIWSEGVKDAHVVFEQFMQKFNAADVPMAVTFGNHDSEEIITRSDLRRIFDATVTNRAEKGNSHIVDDREAYTLEIKGSTDDEVKNVLYVIDSGADAPLSIGTYDWVLPEHVEWFKQTAKTYQKGDGVKRNLVFQHIPVPEYWQAAENILSGNCNETNDMISAPFLNTGLFANMVLDGEVWGMFVGHDHDNNFDGLYHGIHLVYGQVSGYQTYGDEPRGVRVIELDEQTGKIDTYTVTLDELDK